MATQSTNILLNEQPSEVLQPQPLPLLQICTHVTLFSAIGVIARIYTSFQNTFLPGHIYPQLVGCFIMGIVVSSSFPPLLKVGLTTGLCGSITSFSTFILQTYLFFHSNAWDAFVCIGVVSGLCYSAFRIGSHIKLNIKFPDNPKIALVALVVIFPTIVALELVFASFSAGFAVLLGPIGAMIRWYLSRYNNSIFPVGTFFTNVAAVALVCILRLAENNFMSDRIGCAWIVALEYGLIGCLSTVSSFVAELDKLEVGFAYRYFAASILSGLLIAFAVLGSFKLSGNVLLSCNG